MTATPAHPPRWRRMRPSARGALLALLALLAALAGCEILGWPFLRQPLAHQLGQRLNLEVQLDGPFRLHLLWRPGLEVAHLRLGSAAPFEAAPLLDAQALELRWHWWAPWRRQAGQPWPIERLQARRLEARLSRHADGRANWGRLLGAAPASAARARPLRPAMLPLRVGTLAVQSGHVMFDDSLRALALQARFMLQEDGRDGGADGGRFEAVVKGHYRDQPVALQAESQGLLPLLDQGAGRAVPVFVQGRVGRSEGRFRGIAADLLGGHALRGSLLLRGASLAELGQVFGLTLPATPAFRVAGALRHEDGVWGLVATEGRVGRSRLVADLRFDTRARPLKMSGTLGAGLLRLQDLGPAVGAAAPDDVARPTPVLDPGTEVTPADPLAAPRSSAAPAGRVLPARRFDLPALRAMDADLSVDIRRFEPGDPATLEPLHDLHARLELDAGVLTLDGLKADVAGGRLQGRTRLDAADPTRDARWQADLRLDGLRLERWIAALHAPAAQGSAGDAPAALGGALDLRLDLRGQGQSTADILGSLDGRARARLREGRISHLLIEIAGLDLAQSLGVWLRGDKALVLHCAELAAEVDDGVLRVSHAVADTSDSRLALTGQVDLNKEQLALRVRVKPKDFSPLSLRAPLVLGGSLAAPVAGVEGGRVAGRLLAAAALAAAAPVAALLPLLEFGDAPDRAEPCGAPPKKPAGRAAPPASAAR